MLLYSVHLHLHRQRNQGAVACFFIVQSYKYLRYGKKISSQFKQTTKSVNSGVAGAAETTDRLQECLRHLSRWTLASAIWMLIMTFTLPFGASSFIWRAQGWRIIWIILLMSRVGISLCQVRALRPAPTTNTTKPISVVKSCHGTRPMQSIVEL